MRIYAPRAILSQCSMKQWSYIFLCLRMLCTRLLPVIGSVSTPPYFSSYRQSVREWNVVIIASVNISWEVLYGIMMLNQDLSPPTKYVPFDINHLNRLACFFPHYHIMFIKSAPAG